MEMMILNSKVNPDLIGDLSNAQGFLHHSQVPLCPNNYSPFNQILKDHFENFLTQKHFMTLIC